MAAALSAAKRHSKCATGTFCPRGEGFKYAIMDDVSVIYDSLLLLGNVKMNSVPTPSVEITFIFSPWA